MAMALNSSAVRLLARRAAPPALSPTTVLRGLRPASRPFSSTPIRMSDPEGWLYRGVRQGNYEAKTQEKLSVVVSAIIWAWLTYNVLVDYQMLTGHHPYPDRKQMTNAQLGIPDDE